MTSIGEELTILESRINTVEQRSAVGRAPAMTVVPNPTTGAPEIHDPLTWDSGWIQHTTIAFSQPNPALPGYPGASWVHYTGGGTEYGPAQVIRVGSMAHLTGLLVRSGSTLSAGGGYGIRMFMLPTGWRPPFRVKLPCVMNGGSPAVADIEVRPDVTAAAGGVYFTIGQADLTGGSGWIALQGGFPCLDVPAV